jgi:hypothetical protein
MTRGRDANHAYVVIDENQTAPDVLAQAITRDWIDQPAVERRAQLDHRHPPLQDARGGEELARLEEHIRRITDDRVRAERLEHSQSRALER